MTSVLFAEQEAFGAQFTKEKLAVEWALEQSRIDNGWKPHRRRAGMRRSRDGRELFVVCNDGSKLKKTDWLALDAKRMAEHEACQADPGSWRHRSRELCLASPAGVKREKSLKSRLAATRRGSRRLSKWVNPPFRVVFPLPAKGAQMRQEAACDQLSTRRDRRTSRKKMMPTVRHYLREQPWNMYDTADLFVPRPETVALSALEKRVSRKWGLDVDKVEWADGKRPPPWVKAVGNTTNKWANKELWMKAAKEEHELLDRLVASSGPSSSLPQDTGALESSPPWIKELPPVRDLRKQLASGKVLPFLNQRDYPESRVAERKRTTHGRTKRAFVSTAKAVLKISPTKAVGPPDANGVRHFGERRVAAHDGFEIGKVPRLDTTERSVCPERDRMIGYISPISGDTMSSGANCHGDGSPSHESVGDRKGARPAKACHMGAETSRRSSRARRDEAGSRRTSAAADSSVSGSTGGTERVEPAENPCDIPVRLCGGCDRTNQCDSSEQRLRNDGEGVKTDDAFIEDVGSLSPEVEHPTRGKDSGSDPLPTSVGNPAAVVTSSVRVTEIGMLPH